MFHLLRPQPILRILIPPNTVPIQIQYNLYRRRTNLKQLSRGRTPRLILALLPFPPNLYHLSQPPLHFCSQLTPLRHQILGCPLPRFEPDRHTHHLSTANNLPDNPIIFPKGLLCRHRCNLYSHCRSSKRVVPLGRTRWHPRDAGMGRTRLSG